MHGLVNRSIECFVRDTYGAATWSAVTRAAATGFETFEAMLTYDAALTGRVIDAAADVLRRPHEAVLEDLGTYLVCNPNAGALRRLLRFGGPGFVDFLHSLDDLPDLGRLALPSLAVPQLTLTERSPGTFVLWCICPIPGTAHVLMGLLRAMADDYGALVVLELQAEDGFDDAPGGPDYALITIRLLDPGFAEGRRFDLALA